MERYQDSDQKTIDSELTALLTEELIGNEQFIDKVVAEQPNIAMRFVKKIQNLIKLFKMSGEKRAEYKVLTLAENMYLRSAYDHGRQNLIQIIEQGREESSHYGDETQHREKDNSTQWVGEENSNKRQISNNRSGNSESRARFAIKKDASGNRYVEVDEEQFTVSEAPQDVLSILSSIVDEKFKDFVVANGQKIGVNKKTAKEWVWSGDAKKLRQANNQVFADKASAFENADELLQASRDYIGEELKHSRKDNFVEFARGTVQFQVADRGYIADIVVGATKSGAAVLYDIVNIQSKKIVADTPNTTQNRRGGATATNNSISQNRENATILEEKNIKLSRKSPAPSEGDIIKAKGNLTTDKIFTKAEAKKIIADIEERLVFEDKGMVGTGKGTNELIDQLWKGLNKANKGEYIGVGVKIADYVINHTVVEDIYESLLDDVEVEEARQVIKTLKQYFHKVKISDRVLGEIKHHFDDKASKVLSLWRAKEGGLANKINNDTKSQTVLAFFLQ